MIRFSKYMWLYFLISAIVLVPGIFSLVRYGFRPAIDFTGGTLLEISFEKDVPQSVIEQSAKDEQVAVASIQKSEGNAYLLRIGEGSDKIPEFQTNVASASGVLPFEILRNETVGPTLGRELLEKTVTAAVIAIIVILAYIAYAFKSVKFGVSAIIALIHDLLVVLGLFSLFGHFWGVEVDTLFVTAFLTTMSFSVHDTIVVFDRIREMTKRGESVSFEELSDRALTETMGRSLSNSFTIIFMLLALILFGGETIKWFVVALFIGTVSGTYSSPFIATPILILWDRFEKRKKRH